MVRYLTLLLLLTAPLTMAERIVLGVLATRPAPMIVTRFQPLADYLTRQLDGLKVELRALDSSQMRKELSHHQLALILTDPAHYLRMRSYSSFSSALATLVRNERGVATASLGGVIFTRADRQAVTTLQDLAGQRIAIPEAGSLGGDLAQRFELLENSPHALTGSKIIEKGSHEKVVAAVLADAADVGFIRTGVIEDLVARGQMEAGQLRLLNTQKLMGYPYRSSTRLYPEWPMVALPTLDDDTQRRVVAALLALEADHPAARAAGINGFKPPADYLVVERILRDLGVAPFDEGPEIRLQDVWHAHWVGITTSGILFLALLMLLFLLGVRNRQLEQNSRLLNESSAVREAILKNLPDLVFLKDPDGRYLAANPLFERFFNAPERDILGHDDYQFLSSHEAEFFRAHDRKALEAGRPTRNEEWVRFRADGEEALLETTKVPIHTADGRLIGILGIGHDITERKRAEQALRISEERLRQSQRVAHIGHYTFNFQEDRWTSSEELDRIFGIDKEYPRTQASWLQIVHPQMRQELADYLASEVLENRQKFDKEYRVIAQRLAITRWVHGIGQLRYDANGCPLELFGTIQEISDRKQAEIALKESQRKLVEAQYISRIGDFVWDLRSDELVWSSGMYRLLGYEQGAKLDIREIDERGHHPEDRAWVVEWFRAGIDSGRGRFEPIQYRMIRKDGETIHVETNIRIEHEDRKAIKVFGTCQDITRQKKTEEALRLAEDVFIHAREGIIIADADATIIRTNPAFTRITGYTAEEALGMNPRILQSGRQDRDFYVAMWRDLMRTGQWYGELWNRRKCGEIYPQLLTISAVRDGRGEVSHYVSLFSDITPQKLQQQQLEHIAHHDPLTHLPNRILLADRLHQSMAHARRRKVSLALAYLDLDGFKEVNDNHGHDAGDHLLVTLASRFRETLREGDTIARLGGDEFGAVLIDAGDSEADHALFQRLLAAAARPVEHKEATLKVTASIGITFYPQSRQVDAQELLRQADQAMYQAKLAGKGRYRLFESRD
jgi:diguanylate cyclase (GGDEF)-like protein/PAS domain S-box-containing protein